MDTARQHNNADIVVFSQIHYKHDVQRPLLVLCGYSLHQFCLQQVRIFCLRTSFALLALRLSISLIVRMSTESFFLLIQIPLVINWMMKKLRKKTQPRHAINTLMDRCNLLLGHQFKMFLGLIQKQQHSSLFNESFIYVSFPQYQ